MREFVFGRAEQYRALDSELSQGKKYKYENRKLPLNCSPATATLWFGKIGDIYHIFIDRGIMTDIRDNGFREFLANGEMKFQNMDEVMRFFHSLQHLYEEKKASSNVDMPHPHYRPVIDRAKLRAITEAGHRPRKVEVRDIAGALKYNIYGQNRVLDSLAEKVVVSQMRKEKKLLAIALLGPTAVGKSETAKSLTKAMTGAYGREYGYLEIAANEFLDSHTVNRFFGAPPGYVGHGSATLLEPVRKNPNHVIVINEIEKAHPKILEGLMEAIDTGKLGMADNSPPINLNSCIMLFTSNIPIDMQEYESLSSDFERAELCRDAFTKHCGRPEISGKIGNFLVFNPLDDEAITNIVLKFIREELKEFGLGLEKIDEYLMAEFLQFRTKYGARAIKNLINDTLGTQLIKTPNIEDFRGGKARIKGSIDSIELEFNCNHSFLNLKEAKYEEK